MALVSVIKCRRALKNPFLNNPLLRATSLPTGMSLLFEACGSWIMFLMGNKSCRERFMTCATLEPYCHDIYRNILFTILIMKISWTILTEFVCRTWQIKFSSIVETFNPFISRHRCLLDLLYDEERVFITLSSLPLSIQFIDQKILIPFQAQARILSLYSAVSHNVCRRKYDPELLIFAMIKTTFIWAK